MKIPFDIKYRQQIESGEYKVETRDGTPVKIVKWDCRSPHGEAPILAILHGDYDYNRTYSLEGYSTCDSDRLFLITPERNEFEQAVKDLCWKVGILGEVFYKDVIIKKTAAELLELARKEIEEELKEKVLHDYYKQASDQCAQARKEAKAEALKDLPRWKKLPNCIMKQVNLFGRAIIVNNHYILYSDLEKLPGFKED